MKKRPYRIISVSLYVEELVALDAKVEAMRAAGFYATRSRLLVISAMALEDGAFTRDLERIKPRRAKVKEAKARKTETPRKAWRIGGRCGACGIHGHNRRTCLGIERESKL